MAGTAHGAPKPASSTEIQADTHAGVQRVAIVRLTFSGDVPAASRELFEARLVEGLAVARFQVVSGQAVTQALEQQRLARCADSACYPKVAEALQVGYLLGGRIEEASKSYDIDLTIINGRTGDTIARASERCETCGIAEAAEKVALATASLRTRLEALATTPARVIVRSRPAGAQARLDGKPAGRTPLDLELPGGQHRIALALDGYSPVERTFTVVSGVDEDLSLELLRLPSALPLKILGWLGVIGGAALIGGGVYAAGIDGRAIDCNHALRDINGRCPRIRDTDALAVALTGVGAVALSLGGVSLWLASQEGPGAGAAAPGPQGDGDASLPAVSRTFGLRYHGRL